LKHNSQWPFHDDGSAGVNSTSNTISYVKELGIVVGRPYFLVLQDIKEENDWKNDLVLFWLSPSFRKVMPRMVASWLRNYIATMGLFFGVGAAWSYYIYWCFGTRIFGSGNMPSAKDVLDQVKVAVLSIPLYAVLPALTEWVVENGYTRTYSRISDVGVLRYWAFFALYMVSVEFCVYWQHRGLHDITLGYRVLHAIHHKYNKEHSMSPFAGLAFHPMDGILQALPYCWTLFFVPMHFLTHELLLFATGVWTANIHDNIHGRVEPIMGAGYHTIHHTAYRYNYGHYTTLVDSWYGTLLTPEDYPAWLASRVRPAAMKGEAGVKLVAVDAGLQT